MNRTLRSVVILAALAAAGVAGFRLGRTNPTLAPTNVQTVPVVAAQRAPSGPVIYYRDPDGKPLYSLDPKLAPGGRPYRAVLASEDINFDQLVEADQQATKTSPAPATADRRIAYYRNPMGLPDVSKTPKKDPMGMDYIPVYEGEDDDAASVKISPGRLQRIGVKTEPAKLRTIAEPVRAPGSIQSDERRISVVTLRAEAFIDSVENVTVGSEVRKGQALMRVYSPIIAQTAADFAATLGPRADALAPRGARQRLIEYFDVPPQFLSDIERTREVPRTFAVPSPRDGVVLERNVSDGMRIMPGDVLFRIVDHSLVWALVDVAERDIAAIGVGQQVKVRVRSYPDRTFAGKVTLVYPHLNPATRTVRVRIELPNREFLLKPDMYAEAEIETGTGRPVLAVPDSAVIDGGDRRLVIVDKGEGRFEPRAVQLGRRGSGYVEIRDGVQDGESVVTTANFLIDAESNLRAALKSLAGAEAAP